MLSSRFLVLGFLYTFYAAGLVAAVPHHVLGGGNQSCQNVRTVTVTETVGRGQPSPNPQPPKNTKPNSPPAVTTRPGDVNLGNGGQNTGGIKANTKTTTTPVNTITNPVKNGNGNGNVNTKTTTSPVNSITNPVKNGNGNGNVNTNTKNPNTNTKGPNTNTKKPDTNTKDPNTNTKNVNTKTAPPPANTKTPDTNTKDPKTNTKNVNTSTETGNTKTAPPPANTGTGNPSTGLTLDPSVIQNVDGKGKAAGEADSLVSPNDFINFCVGKTLTNGKQVQAGSCNPVPMGEIPSVDNMPSAKFNFPKNFGTIAANTPFTISLQVRNFGTGTFTNAANTYYAAPQQLVNGVIQGHSHVTVQKMTSLDSPEPLNPKIFDFFKGLNAAAKNGILTADVTKGLPVGVYRIASINSAGNHQEALGPIAQRGSFNDAVYITVTEDGKGANPGSSGTQNPTVPVPSPTGNGGKDGKDPKTTLTNLPVPTETGGKNDTVVPSPEPPVKGGKDPKTSTTLLPTGGKDNATPSPVKDGKDPKTPPTPQPTGKDNVVPPPVKDGKDPKTSPTPQPTGGKDNATPSPVKGGKDPKTPPTPQPTGKDNVLPPPVKDGKNPKTTPTPQPTGGKDNVVPPPESPVPTNGGKKGSKGGDATSTSTSLPKTTTPVGNGKGPNGQYSKRMHRRSRLA